MTKRVSLKDIAQKVGVSTALVSYVLNNKKQDRIGKEVAQRIRNTAKELNYRTNLIARSLKTNKTFTIGLIVADISNPYFSSLARIIEDEADKYNYTVVFGSSDEDALKSGKLIDVFLNRHVDGLIIAPAEDTIGQILSLQQQDIPFVLIDRYFPECKTNHVALDDFKAAYKGVKHLADQGFSRIGMITYNNGLFNLLERKRGWLAALKDSGIAFKKNWLREIGPGPVKQAVEKALQELLSMPQPVDALLFASNTIALHALKHINAMGIKVPQELAVLSFDETEAFDLFYAPLTYIRQPLQEMGQAATRILLESIGRNNKITQVNLEGELVIRQSTSRNPGKR
ncbi:MAG: substrate-binding domain-containing protein [Puia sp.]|nr:substrate-binding domain-containing protein [Puia sp.]